jgi:ABC-type amino acid transport/signal transduction systems, periplasmic component/domain
MRRKSFYSFLTAPARGQFRRPLALGLACLLAAGWASPAPAGAAGTSTLASIRADKDLRCGVFPDDPGRSAIDASGQWQGFYVDFCRAVAAAVLGNPDFVQYVEVGSRTRFTSLVDRKVDVVMYSTTWTLGREDEFKVAFPAVYLFDSQGVMVRRQSGITRLEGLRGKSICVTENTTTQKNIEDINHARDLGARIVLSNGDSFFRGACDAYSADRANLATNRANRADNPGQYVILPELLSREPIGPMVRDDDAEWIRVVRLVVDAVILAEELGLTRDNVDEAKAGGRGGETDVLLGNAGSAGGQVGLDRDWAYRVVKAVGNYGEIFDRNFGPDTPIGLERGLNRLWSRGGLLYAPRFK